MESTATHALTRQLFSEGVAMTRLPTVQVAKVPFNVAAVARRSQSFDITIVLGDLSRPEIDELDRMGGAVVWVPMTETEESRACRHTLVRAERSIGCVTVVGAPCMPPSGSASDECQTDEREMRRLAFERDTTYLQDVPNRRPDDGQITLVATVGTCPPLLAADTSDISAIFREMGVRLKEHAVPGAVARMARATRNAISRYASILVDQNGTYLPQMPLLPITVGKRSLLGARMELVESPLENVREFCVADLPYTMVRTFSGSVKGAVVLRELVFEWARAVAFADRSLSGMGLVSSIEALPLSALGSANAIVIGICIEGISAARAVEVGTFLNETFQRSTPGCRIFYYIDDVESIAEISELIKGLDRTAIDLIRSVVYIDNRAVEIVPSRRRDDRDVKRQVHTASLPYIEAISAEETSRELETNEM